MTSLNLTRAESQPKPTPRFQTCRRHQSDETKPSGILAYSGSTPHLLLYLRLRVGRQPHGKGLRIARLHENGAGPCACGLVQAHIQWMERESADNLPVNLHTKPSPPAMLDTIPPDATRSRTYLQFHATRCPLSM